MKKWLVGLMTAGLCVASAWAETVTYTVASKAVTVTAGTEPEGASAVYEQTYSTSGQATANNSMTLTLKGYDGTTITGLTLRMHSNTSKGGGSLGATCGSDTIASIADSKFNDGWYSDWSKDFVDITPAVTETAISGDVVIKIEATENSLFIESYTIEYEAGEPQFSVTFDKENWFKVALGEASSVTALPKNGVEPYTFLWSCDKASDVLTGTEATLVIPDTLDEGDYTLNCQVTDDNGEGDVINKQIGFTVAAIPVITGDNFELVSSSDDLQDGARVLVTDVTHAFAMSSEATGSALASVDVTETDGVITASDESIMWTLVEDSDGNFALQNGDQYVGWPSGNAAKMQAEPFANKISVAEGVATITAASDTTRNLKYNKSSPRFAYYTSAQTDLALFKEAGETGFSVTLDKANGFTVDLGTPDSITATAKNGAEPYEYVWSSDTAELNGTGETLAIPATLAEGDYTVQVEVTDAESNKVNKQIGFSVVAPAVKYKVQVAIGILNGGVTADKEEAEEGELVTLTASPAAGYKLGTFLVDDAAIDGSTFNMPAKDVLVSATFVEKPVVAGFTKIMSLDELTEGEYVITGAKAAGEEYAMMASVYDGKTAYLERRETAVELEEDVVTDAEDSIIWTLAQGENGWTIYNEAVGYAGYVASGNSSGAEAEPSAKSSWTIAESENEGLFLLTNVGDTGRYLLYNASNPRFACYTNLNSGKHLAFYKGASGPAVPSVSLSASATEVEVGEPVTITATAKNFSAEPKWSWTGNGTADGAVFTLDTSVADTYEVTATATAGEETASKSVTITVKAPAVKYAVNVALGIQNGTVTTDVSSAAEGDPVTVTATPADGYRLVAIIVNNGDVAVSGNTFVMPAQEVLVTATFEEFEVPPYYFQFETGANIAYAATEAEIDNTGSTKDEVPTVGFSVQRATRGKDAGDKVVGTYALRLAPIGETNAFAYNSKAFAEALTAISFQYGIYGTSDKCDSFTVSTSEDGETWTVLADLSESAATELKTFESSELPANTYFIRFDSTSTVKGNTRRMCIDEIQLFTGAPKPSISYTGDTTVKIPGSFSLQFSVKNYEGTVAWAVTSREGGTISEAGLYTWTPTEATDGITISVSATGEGLDLSKSVTLVVEPKDEPGPGEPTLTCEEGTTINATVDKELVLHFTLANAEFFTGDGAESLIGNTSSLGEVSDITATSFVWTYTPTETGTVTLDFYAMSEGYESVIIESYTVTLNVTEGGGGGDAVTVKSYVVNADGSVTVTLSDGSTTSAGLQYSTDLKNWSTTPVNVKTAASAFVRVGAPE